MLYFIQCKEATNQPEKQSFDFILKSMKKDENPFCRAKYVGFSIIILGRKSVYGKSDLCTAGRKGM